MGSPSQPEEGAAKNTALFSFPRERLIDPAPGHGFGSSASFGSNLPRKYSDPSGIDAPLLFICPRFAETITSFPYIGLSVCWRSFHSPSDFHTQMRVSS